MSPECAATTTQADFEAWFEASVKPAFPEGGPMPSITFDQLNDVVKAERTDLSRARRESGSGLACASVRE
jgi:hypothetical protein